jgi:hypothetical protein
VFCTSSSYWTFCSVCTLSSTRKQRKHYLKDNKWFTSLQLVASLHIPPSEGNIFKYVPCAFKYIPYFPAYSAQLTYNAHPKLFCIPFEVQIMHTTFVTLYMYLCTDHQVICGQLENCTLTFFCPLALKDNLGGLYHSLVTNCLKGRCTFFVFNLYPANLYFWASS